MRIFKDSLIVGLAVFSLFFGAGNLIFPPKLGILAGTDYLQALAGYLLTVILLPIMGILALNNGRGGLEDFARCLGNKGTKLLVIVVYLIIGPLFAIPRTAATSFEMFVSDSSSMLYPVLFSAIYFGIVLAFIFRKDKVIENIGKIFTPVLLVVLFFIIYKSIFIADPKIVDTGFERSFEAGFFNGYQTMDALASMMFGGMVLHFLNSNKYEGAERRYTLLLSVTIAAVLLTLVYSGLLLVGANFSGILSPDLKQVETLVAITNLSIGKIGRYTLAICVLFACFTTAAGLVASVSDYFSKLTNYKVSYQSFAFITAAISLFISISGVDAILLFAVPALTIVYPVVIVLIITNFFMFKQKNITVQRFAIFGALLVAIPSGIDSAGLNLDFLKALPLNDKGLSWLLPSISAGVVGYLYYLFNKKVISVEEKSV